jgi:tRNA (guanine37-N1)-methyltransferase
MNLCKQPIVGFPPDSHGPRLAQNGLGSIAPQPPTRSPSGAGHSRPFRQALAADLAGRSPLLLVCPRYEGVDERVRRLFDLELSLGDYVLSGGELAAMVVIDAVLRLLPGAIDTASPVDESFADGLLEYPQYTRPPEFDGERVPDVLLSGNHAAIAAWRMEQRKLRTKERRPDLWRKYEERLPP